MVDYDNDLIFGSFITPVNRRPSQSAIAGQAARVWSYAG